MPILDDQGAEMLLAVGFTGVLASRSRRGSRTKWPREPGRPGKWAMDKSIDIFQWNPQAAPV